MTHGAPQDLTEVFTQEFWDARYRTAERIWSGNPNRQLVEQASSLPTGVALDIGCGEGADAIWLASRGWQVTAIDVSGVALARAAAWAADAGPQIAARITWERADLGEWTPAADQFDLVSEQFLHIPRAARTSLHGRLAGAVRTRGTLLIVGHHPSDLRTSMQRPDIPDLFSTAEELAADLNAAEWEIVLATASARQEHNPEGRSVTIQDAVLNARRR